MLRLSPTLTLHIDVADWMRQSGKFDKIRATERAWIGATCPFHNDRHPSFAVNVDTGAYRCQACGASGGFVSLVMHVEGHASYDDAETHLIVTYGRYVPDDSDPLTLEFDDIEEETFVEAPTTYRSNYLDVRGISVEAQSTFGAGIPMYDNLGVHGVVVLPWFDAKGRCVTIKYRSTSDKRFWYDPPISAGRLKRLLYGFHLAREAKLIVVCEGEIDAMSVVQSGYSAVALGGANFSDSQAMLLRNSMADEIVVFTDNDEAGRRVRAKIIEKLVGHKRVSVVDWSLAGHWKDANDVLLGHGEGYLRWMIENRIPVGLSLDI